MKKLRLLLFEECNRQCLGCCNKDWDLSSLSVETNFSQYELVMLTGGEPMLYPHIVIATTQMIRKQTDVPIYLYTAKVNGLEAMSIVLLYVDGLTVTLHEKQDIAPFKAFNDAILCKINVNDKSLRLNVFNDIDIDHHEFPLWEIKTNIKWIKNCPLPKDEVFKRI